MPRLILLLVALPIVVALAGCVEAIAAIVAPEAVAGQAAGSLAQSAGDGLNSLVSDASTINDLDRILADLPADSPQRADLSQLRQQLGDRDTTRRIGADHRFASDPQLGLESDHRLAEDAERTDSHSFMHGFEIPQGPDRGHLLLIDPPRALGVDPLGPRDAAMPFHSARASELDTWQPRWYGPSMPSLPQPPDHRGLDD